MKVIALLSWYEETPSWLAATAASLAGFADHLVAVDGAYKLYPNGRPSSTTEQHDALREACHATGVGLTIHTPTTVWAGNEVEKRAFMFKLGLAVAEPSEDWFLIIDGDTLLHPSSEKIAARRWLQETDYDVADVTMWTRTDPELVEALAAGGDQYILPRDQAMPFRSLFRALSGLTVEGLHYVYTTRKDGRRIFLWHPPDRSGAEIEPSTDLSGMLVLEHRNKSREMGRAQDSRLYYAERDRMNIEAAADYRAELEAGRP
jgi:hypothetical protein